jgi:hypothetical protein
MREPFERSMMRTNFCCGCSSLVVILALQVCSIGGGQAAVNLVLNFEDQKSLANHWPVVSS